MKEERAEVRIKVHQFWEIYMWERELCIDSLIYLEPVERSKNRSNVMKSFGDSTSSRSSLWTSWRRLVCVAGRLSGLKRVTIVNFRMNERIVAMVILGHLGNSDRNIILWKLIWCRLNTNNKLVGKYHEADYNSMRDLIGACSDLTVSWWNVAKVLLYHRSGNKYIPLVTIGIGISLVGSRLIMLRNVNLGCGI